MSETLSIVGVVAGHGFPATIGGTITGGVPVTLDISYDGGNTFPDTVGVTYGENGAFTLVGTTVL